MKRKALFGLILTLSLNFVSFPAYALNSKEVNTAPIQGIVNNKIEFQVISEVDAPKPLLEKLNMNKDKRGFVYTVDDSTGYIYIAVMSGTKPTGGYSIEVTGIEDNEGRTNVFVKEVSPSKDMMVTQAITYPYTIVKARGITPNITVKNLQGDKFNYFNKESINNRHWKDLKKYTNVAEHKEWTIKFNKGIKDLILTNDTVYVLDNYGNKVDVKLSASYDNTYVKVTPIANYENAQNYYLFISKNIDGEDRTKSNIAGYRMMFTIRDAITVE